MEEPSFTIITDLNALPYLGQTRINMLRERGIEDIEGLRALSDEELAGVGYLGLANARRVRAALEGNAPPSRRSRRAARAAAAKENGASDPPVESEPAPAPPRRRRRGQAATAASGAPGENGAPRRRRRAPTVMVEALPLLNAPLDVEPAAVDVEAILEEVVEQLVEAAEISQDQLDYQAALDARRAELPAAVLHLMEAIRAAAIAPALERQAGRLLQVADALTVAQSSLPEKRQRQAALALNETHAALTAAFRKRRFGLKAQEQLADDLRTQRRKLEKLLDRANRDVSGR